MKVWTPEEIKAFRKRYKFYQRELASLLGVTREYVIFLEKGVRTPSKTLTLFLDCLSRQLKEKGKGVKKNGNRHLQKK
jgi:DNA-binding XRE family transcriptional regulator